MKDSRVKPNFFLVGAPKCATTSWASYLSGHPQIVISDPKEPQYFCTDIKSKYHPKISTPDEYLKLFDVKNESLAIGEATPIYLCSKTAISGIRKFNRSSKIIILLRNQVDYIWSLHQQFLYRRIEKIQDPNEAWRKSGNRNFSSYEEPEILSKLLDYKRMADFESQIRNVLDNFPDEQVFVAWMEDWKDDPGDLWRAICEFLEVSIIEPPVFYRENSAKYHRSALLSKITNRPPKFLLYVSALLKKVLGKKRLNISGRVRDFNRVDGYRHSLTESIKKEIMLFYEAGNERINADLEERGCLYKNIKP